MWRTARRRSWRVPERALVINFSTNGRSSFAFASVVSMAPCSMSDDSRFRRSASFCSLVRRSCRPALRCRIALLLHVVGRGGGGPAWRGALIEHAHTAVSAFFEPHPEIQILALEEIGDLLKRFLAEVLDLQDLAFGLPDQIAERADVGILERVHRADGQLEVVDRRAQKAAEPRSVAGTRVAVEADRRR